MHDSMVAAYSRGEYRYTMCLCCIAAGSTQPASQGGTLGKKKRGNKFKVMEPVAVSGSNGVHAATDAGASEPVSRFNLSHAGC